MRTVVFVDDMPEVLRMLQRTLDPIKGEWDMRFVGSASEALAVLEQGAVDVLATDLLMPGMDGLQLLKEAKVRYPMVVRIAFSGQQGQGLGLRSTDLAHQFLEKPIDAERLRSIMARACGLRALLADDQLRTVVTNLKNLPSLPALYQELMNEIHSRDASLKKVAKIIGKDMAMVTKILQLVNSAFFGLRTTVSNPEQAVALLGSDTIRALVLSMQAFSQFDGVALPGFSLNALWQHGLKTSGFAKVIAQQEQAPQAMVDEAFTAGLLHDIGLLLLASNKPEDYQRVLKLQKDNALLDWQAEQEIFGVTHAEVGAYLLSLWGVGEAIVESVAFHHRPSACGDSVFSPLTAVHVANAIAESENSAGGESRPVQIDEAYLTKLGKLDQLAAWKGACQPDE
ncbi:MAG: HDOD domain-containing protein [Nitrospira sp.]|nr:HDOD domain-containing protein [Nitrospira sp.]